MWEVGFNSKYYSCQTGTVLGGQRLICMRDAEIKFVLVTIRVHIYFIFYVNACIPVRVIRVEIFFSVLCVNVCPLARVYACQSRVHEDRFGSSLLQILLWQFDVLHHICLYELCLTSLRDSYLLYVFAWEHVVGDRFHMCYCTYLCVFDFSKSV